MTSLRVNVIISDYAVPIFSYMLFIMNINSAANNSQNIENLRQPVKL